MPLNNSKILVTDHMFPSKYAKWRIEGLKAFVDNRADIIVNKVDSFAGIEYHIDYEEMKEYYNLSDYNIFIFDKKYEHLNKYNSKIDGCKYISQNKGYSYAFSLNDNFELTSYDKIYHMFLSGYTHFNNIFKFDFSKQFIHLYPGGTFNNELDLQRINKETKIISTQPYTSSLLNKNNFKFIECFGSTCLPQNISIHRKKLNTDILNVCFSSMGIAKHKGIDDYNKIVNFFRNEKNIKFHFVGNYKNLIKDQKIQYHEPMSQKDLDQFYREKIDILINTETGESYNGWPLGVEALIQGCVLITTDTHNANLSFKYKNDMIFIINHVSNIITAIRKLNNNRKLLNAMSIKSQNYTISLMNYKKQQEKILKYIYDE